MTQKTISIALAVVVFATATALAAGTWTDKISFRYSSGGTTLKVADPEGFKVAVAMPDGTEKTGTVPELFTLPDADAFVKVTVTAADGSQWTKKVEIRAKQQTELSLAFKADEAKPEAKPSSRSYVGKLHNLAGGCGKGWDRGIKAEFLNADGASVKSVLVDPEKTINIEIAGGKYDVRVFVNTGEAYDFVLTASHDIAKDGWKLGFGCPKGTRKPALIVE